MNWNINQFFYSDNDYNFQAVQRPHSIGRHTTDKQKFATYAKPWIYIHVMISPAFSIGIAKWGEIKINKHIEVEVYWIAFFYLVLAFNHWNIHMNNSSDWKCEPISIEMFLDFDMKRPKSVIHFKYLNRFSVVLKWLLSRSLVFILSFPLHSIRSHCNYRPMRMEFGKVFVLVFLWQKWILYKCCVFLFVAHTGAHSWNIINCHENIWAPLSDMHFNLQITDLLCMKTKP